jgi:hypothetical protein
VLRQANIFCKCSIMCKFLGTSIESREIGMNGGEVA